MKKSAFFLILIFIPSLVIAQSGNYYPLQASYENESFFYNPKTFSPADLGPLSGIEPGFRSSNPLNQIAQNPAWLPDLNGHDLYTYINVQSKNNYKSNNYCYNCYYQTEGPVTLDVFLPVSDTYRYADGKRLNQEPFLTAALVGYPFKNKHIFAGIIYQALASKGDYYAYPSISYPQGSAFSEVGTNAVTPLATFQKSNLKQNGQFVSLYGGYKVSARTVAGLRINAVLFQRSGGYGNPQSYYYNPWIYTAVTSGNTTTPSSMLTEQRAQHYRHINFDLGARHSFNSNLTGMIHLGYLAGSGDENLNIFSPYNVENGTPNSGQYYERIQSGNTYLYQWNNSGHTLSGGLSLLFHSNDSETFQVFYEVNNNVTGFTPNGQAREDSQILNQHTSSTISSEVSTTHSNTIKTGNGSQHSWTNNFGIFYEWSPARSLTLKTGLQFGFYDRNTHSLEYSQTNGLVFTQILDTAGHTTQTQQPKSSQEQTNWKDLIHEQNFQIPFIAQFRLFGRLQVWGGFNEQVESIRAKDNLFNPNPSPPAVYPVGIYTNNSNTVANPAYNYKYNTTLYRFTLLSGVNFEVNNRVTLHFTALPLDHRYGLDRVFQTSGLIWQAGVSIYP